MLQLALSVFACSSHAKQDYLLPVENIQREGTFLPLLQLHVYITCISINKNENSVNLVLVPD